MRVASSPVSPYVTVALVELLAVSVVFTGWDLALVTQTTAKDTTVYLDLLYVLRALDSVSQYHNLNPAIAKAKAM